MLIESPQHTHGITVTKDGVTVAKSIQLFDPVENLAVQMMREAASRTAANAGDGTTTAIVLTEAIVKTAIEKLEDAKNKPQVLRDMVSVTNDVVKSLQKRSTKVSEKKLLDVASISANNDGVVGKIIADTYNQVGDNGIVTVSYTHLTLPTIYTV